MLRTPSLTAKSRLLPTSRNTGACTSPHCSSFSCLPSNTTTTPTRSSFRAFMSGATTPRLARKLMLLEPYPPGRVIEFDPDTLSQKVLVENTPIPDGIQVDVAANRMWWTNMGPHFDTSTGDSMQADASLETSRLDGSERRKLLGNGLMTTCKQLTYDKDSQQLYFCDREGMRVFRVDADGSNLTVLVQTGVFPQDTKDASRHCVGIAVDKKRAGKVYWTQKGPWTGGEGSIRSVGLTIPPGEDAATRSDINVLVDKLPAPIDLELSHDGSKLYWTDRTASTLNVADLSADGSSITNQQVLAGQLQEPIALAVDNERNAIFITSVFGHVFKYNLASASASASTPPEKLDVKRLGATGIALI